MQLWMGTHPSNPSKDLTTGRSLCDLLSDNAALLSPSVGARFGEGKLPFLLKVLSIRKALSIQAHPNKTLAAQLHARDPRNYPDDNHKPEMAIALTEFEALCGFRPPREIAAFLGSVQPLRALVGEEAAVEFEEAVKGFPEDMREPTDESRAALKRVFSKLMQSSQSAIEEQTAKLVALAEESGEHFAGGGVESTSGETLAELVVRLNGQFPNDVGLFVLFFLNYVVLTPGEALFLRADDVHAYLSGDIVECMAASDNVVRAGLTPKFKDVATLVDMLTYSHAPIDEQKLTPVEYPYAVLDRPAYSAGGELLLYDPPIDEFSVVRLVLRGGLGKKGKATFDPIPGPSIVICTGGKGTVAVGETKLGLECGWIYFVGATAELVVEKAKPEEGHENDDEDLVVFRAFVEVDEPDVNGAGQ